jgi:polar amino acid transport system substrate-binding protein
MRVRSRARTLGVLIAVGGLVIAGCGSSEDDDDTAQSGNSPASETTAEGAATETAAECVEGLDLVNAGVLTIGTDTPAFPPWFEDDDPTNGDGFEGAVAYAVAEEMGFTTDQVTWTVVPFNNAFAPGAKEFDFDINQVSISPERDEAVDFSDGYYDVNQAIVGFADSEAADATTLDDLKGLKLGAQLGTTSLDFITEVIQPDQEPFVYNDNNQAKSALDAQQVDGIVLDLPTAFFVSATEIEGTAVIGQFPSADDEPEQFGLVFEDGNPLRDCANLALASLTDSGTLDDITTQWLSDVVDAPVIPID